MIIEYGKVLDRIGKTALVSDFASASEEMVFNKLLDWLVNDTHQEAGQGVNGQ